LARFEKTHCSQCGGEFGPGDEGYSHCEDHQGKEPKAEWNGSCVLGHCGSPSGCERDNCCRADPTHGVALGDGGVTDAG
jgi:hypothetical protein